MSENDPPKRTESQELTLVSPRSSLPPVASTRPATIEDLADMERARRDAQDDTPTLVPCPNCEHCGVCKGSHMVAGERAKEFRRQQALLDAGDDADELNQNHDPPPEAA